MASATEVNRHRLWSALSKLVGATSADAIVDPNRSPADIEWAIKNLEEHAERDMSWVHRLVPDGYVSAGRVVKADPDLFDGEERYYVEVKRGEKPAWQSQGSWEETDGHIRVHD